MKTEIAKDIERAKENIQYDTQCKRVLANKVILAWIMKETIDEFSNLSVAETMRCIEGKPQINEVFVEPGRYAEEKIQGLNTEDKDENEGNITYDIRFVAYIPEKNKRVKVFINVEAQKDFYQKYPIQSRGVYYGARMVSSQNGMEFKVPYYGDIKKVYSIWVCMNVPKYIGNAIAVYEFSQRDIVKGVPDNPKYYDKISIIMICLNGQIQGNKSLLDMMNTLLSSSIQVQEKKRILEDEYQIAMDDGLGEELDQMGAFYEFAYENATKATTKAIVVKLLKENLLSDEQIMRVTQITQEELMQIKEDMLCLA